MARGNGEAAARDLAAAPLGAPELPADALAALASAKEQDARYSIRVEFFPAVGLIKFTKHNRLVTELKPEVLWFGYPQLMKTTGQIMAAIDIGPVGVG
jgi:hypothetical protein